MLSKESNPQQTSRTSTTTVIKILRDFSRRGIIFNTTRNVVDSAPCHKVRATSNSTSTLVLVDQTCNDTGLLLLLSATKRLVQPTLDTSVAQAPVLIWHKHRKDELRLIPDERTGSIVRATLMLYWFISGTCLCTVAYWPSTPPLQIRTSTCCPAASFSQENLLRTHPTARLACFIFPHATHDPAQGAVFRCRLSYPSSAFSQRVRTVSRKSTTTRTNRSLWDLIVCHV